MTKLVKTALAALVLLPLTVTQASAACFLIWCWDTTGGEGGGSTTPSAPEIDVTQGFAALAIVAVIALVMREKFLRNRA